MKKKTILIAFGIAIIAVNIAISKNVINSSSFNLSEMVLKVNADSEPSDWKDGYELKLGWCTTPGNPFGSACYCCVFTDNEIESCNLDMDDEDCGTSNV